MRSLLAATLAAASALTALLGAPTTAQAEPYLVAAPEAWLVVPGSGEELAVGPGVTVIGGLGLDYDPLLVGPQIGLGAYVLPNSGRSPSAPAGAMSVEEPADTQSMLRATVGAAVGIAGPIEVSLYFRAGIGRTDGRFAQGARLDSPNNPSASGGVAIDTGISGDYRLDRDLTVGAQLAYAGFVAVGGETGDLHAVALGPRFGYWF